MHGRTGDGQAQIGQHIQGPAGHDDAPAADAVRELAGRQRDHGIDEIEGDQHGQDAGNGQAAFLGAQNDEGIGRIAQLEDARP